MCLLFRRKPARKSFVPGVGLSCVLPVQLEQSRLNTVSGTHVCVLHIEPFFLPVDIQHTQCMSVYLYYRTDRTSKQKPCPLGTRPSPRQACHVWFCFLFFFLFFSFRFFSFLFLPFSHSFFSFFFLCFSSGDDVPVYTVDMCHGIILLQVIGDSTLLYCYRCCCGPAECAVLLLLLLLLSFRVRSV